MKKIIFIVFPVLLLAACSKEITPPDVNEDPVFTVSFNAGGDTGSISAGLNEYYMFTGFDQDSQGVVYTGSLAPATCPSGDCAGSLTFEFRQSHGFDNPLSEGLHQFASTELITTTGYQAIFQANDGLFVYDLFQWSFNGVSKPVNGTDTVSMFFQDSLDAVNVSLSATADNGQSSTVQRFVSVVGPDLYPGADIQVDYQVDSGYVLTALATGPGTPVVSWNTGATQYSISDLTLDQSYSVTVSNGSQYTAGAALQNISPQASTRTANFEYFATPATITTEIVSGEIVIRWVDQQGVAWRSDRGQQIAGASLRVWESDDYQINENGQKTRKMRVEFSCALFNEAGDAIDFTGEGIIAVAYP